MPFAPQTTNTTNFDPADPSSGSNAQNGLLFGCNRRKDRDRIQKYWDDLTRQYGMNVKYWANGYDLDEHDSLYGEHPTSMFIGPKELRALVNIENQNVILSKFGMMTDTDIEFYIPIPAFKAVWGGRIPNRGDLIQVLDEACDRPEDQEAKVFQITEKRDTVEPVDPFAGHYVWYLEAKRFDFSYEDNAPDEGGEQITDTDFVGIMEGGTQETSPEKTYGPNVDDKAQEDLDDGKSGVYGNYL